MLRLFRTRPGAKVRTPPAARCGAAHALALSSLPRPFFVLPLSSLVTILPRELFQTAGVLLVALARMSAVAEKRGHEEEGWNETVRVRPLSA